MDNLAWATVGLLPLGKETTVTVVVLPHELDRHAVKSLAGMA
jgi:hypothetical protein